MGQTIRQRQNTSTSINEAFRMTLVIFEVPLIQLLHLEFQAGRVTRGHAIYSPSFK